MSDGENLLVQRDLLTEGPFYADEINGLSSEGRDFPKEFLEVERMHIGRHIKYIKTEFNVKEIGTLSIHTIFN